MDSTRKITALFFISLSLISSPNVSCSDHSHSHSHKHKKPKTPPPPPTVLKPPAVSLPPPVTTGPPTTINPVPPPAGSRGNKDTCPIDASQLGACVDLLGGFLHIGLGDPVVNHCCPLIHGLVEVEAAVCLCITLKLRLLNLYLYVPLALQLLLTCGKPPPPGFTCTL